MSFGGSVLAMIVTLKNNARARRKAFEYIESKETSIHSHYSLKYKKVSKEKLSGIKNRIRSTIDKENKKSLLLTLLIIFIPSLLAIGGIIRYTNNIKEHNAIVAQNRKERLQFEKENTIRLDASDLNYFITNGNKWLENKNYHRAKIQFYNALKTNPDNYEAFYGLTKAYVYHCEEHNEKCDEASIIVKNAIHKFGENPELHALKSKVTLRK